MAERLLHYSGGESLPPIESGELLLRTPNLRVVTDYKPVLEGLRNGERFFIEPQTGAGLDMLRSAAKAHNIYNFNHRPVYGIRRNGVDLVPCLRADYIAENIPVLFQGVVEMPKPGEDTIPSPLRMEACITQGLHNYTFADGLDYSVPNPMTRHLRLLQATFKDDIPPKVIHSDDPDSYYKVRKNWWVGVSAALQVGLIENEFSDPEMVEEINRFLDKFCNSDFGSPEILTTVHDIAEANKLISKIWDYYGLTSKS